MKLLESFLFTVLIKLCNGSPVYTRSLHMNLISCPTDSNILGHFQAISPCAIYCLDDGDCATSGLACCATSCGTRCVAESILRRGAQEDNEDDDSKPSAQESQGSKEINSLVSKQLDKLREKLNERRIAMANSTPSLEDKSENKLEESDESSKVSSSSFLESEGEGESSYDVTTGFHTTQSTEALYTTTESVGDMFDDYSYYDEGVEDDLEILLMKLLYKMKARQNSDNNPSVYIEPTADELQEKDDQSAGRTSMDGVDEPFNMDGLMDEEKTRKRNSMEKREDELDDVGVKIKNVKNSGAMR